MERQDFYEESSTKSLGPLKGVRVIEATQAVAGPIVGTILAWLGAEVIRCELPGRGELIRPIPPHLDDRDRINSGTWYQSVNQGKQSITLDIREKKGREIFSEIIKKADVVVENFVPGTMDGWGLGYRELKKLNSALIYLSVSGFGLWGPLANKRGMDSVIQAMSGMMSVTGELDGPPMITGMPIVDHITGWQGAIGVLAALIDRFHTGEGQWVDVSLADVALAASDHNIMSAFHTGAVRTRSGSATPQGAPADVFRCADQQYVFVFALLDHMWEKLCDVMGRSDLALDSRTRSVTTRAQHREFVHAIVGEWCAGRTSTEIEALLDAAGVTVGRVLDYTEVARFPQYLEHGGVAEIEHERFGLLRTFGNPVKLAKHKPTRSRAAPDLGAHTDVVLRELANLSDRDLSILRGEGII